MKPAAFDMKSIRLHVKSIKRDHLPGMITPLFFHLWHTSQPVFWNQRTAIRISFRNDVRLPEFIWKNSNMFRIMGTTFNFSNACLAEH